MRNIVQSVAPSVGLATISPVISKQNNQVKYTRYYSGMNSEREVTPPPGFSSLTPLPVTDANNLPPITVSTFTTRSHPEITPNHHASTSANPELIISPAFVDANYEKLESLLRARRRQIRNTEMRRELEYSSDEYDEEIEMEPRPSTHRAHHPILRIGSPASRRVEGRSVGFEGVPERTPTRKEGTVAEGSNGRSRQRENAEVNLPPLLAAHLGRTEGGIPLQPSHASGVEGNLGPVNTGGSLPPIGLHPQFPVQSYPPILYPQINEQPGNQYPSQTAVPYNPPMVYPPYTMYTGYTPNTSTPHPFYVSQPSLGVPPPINP